MLFVGRPQSGKTTFIKTLVSGIPYTPVEGYRPSVGMDLDKWTASPSPSDPDPPQQLLLVDSAGAGHVSITARFLDPKTNDPIVVVAIRLPADDPSPSDETIRSQINELLIPLRDHASDSSVTLHAFVLLGAERSTSSAFDDSEKPSIHQTSLFAIEDRIIVECCVKLPDFRRVVQVQQAWELLYQQMKTVKEVRLANEDQPIAVMMLHRPSGRSGFRSSCVTM